MTLIDELSEAKEGSRDLDAAIVLEYFGYEKGTPLQSALPYTESVDAALTLMPPHHLWVVRLGVECRATVWKRERDNDDMHAVPIDVTAATPALALVIAILKAKEAQ